MSNFRSRQSMTDNYTNTGQTQKLGKSGPAVRWADIYGANPGNSNLHFLNPSEFDKSQSVFYFKLLNERNNVDDNMTFGSVDMTYGEAPVIDSSTVAWNDPGDPASPWVPNPVSPGDGSLNPSDQSEPPEDYGQTPLNNEGAPFQGEGHLESPNSGAEIVKTKLGQFISRAV